MSEPLTEAELAELDDWLVVAGMKYGARRAALEEATKAVCEWCARGFDHPPQSCDSAAIHELLRAEP